MPTVSADLLRTRARGLRRLAALVDRRVVLDVLRRAGDDTWRGPIADDVRADLTAAVHRLDAAADDLLRQAVLLERRADELDLLAALDPVVPR